MVDSDTRETGGWAVPRRPHGRGRLGDGAGRASVPRSHPSSSVTRSVRPSPAKVLVITAPGAEPSELASALHDEGFDVRTSWPSAKGQLQRALGWRPHAVLVDGAEVHGPGRELVQTVTRGSAPVVVLVKRLTGPARDELARLGASSILSRSRPVQEIATTIRRLLDQERLRSSRRRPALGREWRLTRAADPPRARFDRLTPREQAVLRSLIEGMPASVIALESSVSISTVRTQIRSILQKLNVNSQLQAVSLARRAGWPSEASVARGAAHDDPER